MKLSTRYNVARWLRLLLVGGVVVPFGLFTLNSWQMHNAAVRETDLRVTAKARLLREQVTEMMDTNRLAIALVNKMLGTMRWEEITNSGQLQQQLRDLDNSLAQINSITLIDPDDAVANSSLQIPGGPHAISVADQPWIVRLHDLNLAEVVITPLHTGRLSQGLQFAMVQRRSSPDQRYNGLIAVANSPTSFSMLFRGLTIHESFSLALDDGVVLVSNMPNHAPKIADALIKQLDHNETVMLPDGILARIDGFPLVLSYSVESTALTDWKKEVLFDAVTLGFGTAFFVFTCIIAMRSYARESATNSQLQIEMMRRQTAEVEIAHSRRLEALGQLTAGVAHDFNNLLTVVIGNAEQITLSEEVKSKAKANNILTAAQRGATLVAQMLTFARRQMIQVKSYDVASGLQQTASLIGSTLKPNVKLVMIPALAPMVCYLDANEFKLAVLNIVSNADQAMPNGGQLTIQTEAITKYEGLNPRRYVRVSFKDSGEGMSQQVKERVFEPFFTTRGGAAKTGLGLSQVYGFVKQAGGDIAVESELGHGTQVIMYLPMNEPPVTTQSTPPRIVVVDDQEDILDIFGPALEKHGYLVFCTQEPAKALAYLDTHECTLLLTDVVMPAMLGTDLAKRAVARHPQVKVLLMTGFAADVQDFAIIRKPFRMRELLDRIRGILHDDRWAT